MRSYIHKPAVFLLAIMLGLISILSGAGSHYISAAQLDNGEEKIEFDSEHILVKFKANISPYEMAQIHRQYGGRFERIIPAIGVQVITVPKGKVLEKVRAYSAHCKIAYAEPDYLCQAVGEPDDTYFDRQWGVNKVQAPQAWDVVKGSSAVNIAILDTGIDLDHTDLASKTVANANFSNSATTDDIYGHGTHVAGIAAADTNNGVGVAGIGYNSTLMNVKVLGDGGSGFYTWIASGIIWAADNGAEIINMSLGGTSHSLTLESAVEYAWNKGVVVVAAAGNSGISSPFYPAHYVNCVAVAATDSNDDRPYWSNYGDWVDVAAPGVSILSTLVNDGYGYKSGTSMASPHVAGLAGLVFTTVSDEDDDGNLNDEVRNRIEASCDNIGLSGIGHGRINAAKAVGTVPVVPGSISGQVTYAGDGSSIEGATVSDGTRNTITDVDGMYNIADVPPGSYQVTASKDGYESASSTVIVESGTNTVADISLNQIIVLGGIAGYVTDAQGGSAIEGASVTDGARIAVTDASGRYTIADVTSGSYQVTAIKDGYDTSSSTIMVYDGTTTVADFSLYPKPLPVNTMWVSSIEYLNRGKNLFLQVTVTGDSGTVATADIALKLEWSGGITWNFNGTTDNSGTVSFKVGKAPGGSYLATVTSLDCNGFTWDSTRGIISESYVLITSER